MLNAKVILTIGGKMFYLTGMTAIFLFLALFSTEIRAQDSLRSSVYGGEKSTTTRPVAKPRNVVIKKTASTVRRAPRQPVRISDGTKNRLVEVVFTAKESKAEIWLNDRKIGVTDEKFQFAKKIAPGEYKVMAKNNRQVLFSAKKITVTPQQKSFALIDPELNKTKVQTTPVILQTTTTKSELEIALEMSAKVREILERFGDPAKTDSVTQQDWEFVLQTVLLGQLQGYTAGQIEAQRWFASGQIELAKNETAAAFKSFQKSQEYMPTSALPFYGLGNTYFAKLQYSDALKLYQRALHLEPKMAVAYRKLGDTYKSLGKEKEAISAYKNAILFGYDTPETHYLMGVMYLQSKQTEEAVRELEEVVKDMPKAEVFIAIGEAYEKLKRGVSAIENYHRAIYFDPSSVTAHYKLGGAYYEQREYGKAKQSFEKAIELDAGGKILNRVESQKKLREAASKIDR